MKLLLSEKECKKAGDARGKQQDKRLKIERKEVAKKAADAEEKELKADIGCTVHFKKKGLHKCLDAGKKAKNKEPKKVVFPIEDRKENKKKAEHKIYKKAYAHDRGLFNSKNSTFHISCIDFLRCFIRAIFLLKRSALFKLKNFERFLDGILVNIDNRN